MIDISFKNKTGVKPDKLSAVIGADSFFYGLFTNDNKLLESKWYDVSSFNDKDVIDKIKFDIHSTEGLKVKVASSCKPYMHNHTSDAGKLLKFYPAFQNKEVDSDTLTDQAINVDYGISKSHAALIGNIFGKVDARFHISTVLSNYYYPYGTNKMVSFIDKGVVHLMYANDRKFVYYNQFNCEHENDFLYFTLLAYEELNLDPLTVPLELSGKVDSESPIYSSLRNYIKNVDFVRSSILDVQDIGFKEKQHYYLDLFATSICV